MVNITSNPIPLNHLYLIEVHTISFLTFFIRFYTTCDVHVSQFSITLCTVVEADKFVKQTVFSGKINKQTNFWLNRTVGKVKVLSSKCNDKQSRQKSGRRCYLSSAQSRQKSGRRCYLSSAPPAYECGTRPFLRWVPVAGPKPNATGSSKNASDLPLDTQRKIIR